MVPHHRTAIEMATIARGRAQTPDIRRLADRIISAQAAEIDQMRRIHQRLYGELLRPDERAHSTLGLSASEAGMDHSGQDLERLRQSETFDRDFVDMMVPHHRGAVRMAHVVLRHTGDSELQSLAKGIVADQEREIREMNEFRRRTYGAPAPEGGGGHAH